MSRPAFPAGMLTATRIPHWLLTRGIPLGPLQLLETTGHRSGQPRTTPVVVLRSRGDDWIVSPFGETHWVRNIRASPTARLGRGTRLRTIRLADAPSAHVADLLRTYRRRYRFIPFVRAAFEPTTNDDRAAYNAVAHRHPVFRVTSVVPADNP